MTNEFLRPWHRRKCTQKKKIRVLPTPFGTEKIIYNAVAAAYIYFIVNSSAPTFLLTHFALILFSYGKDNRSIFY